MAEKQTEYMTPRRAARILCISRKTIYRWAQQALDGDTTKLPRTRQTCTRRFLISTLDIADLRKRPGGMAEK